MKRERPEVRQGQVWRDRDKRSMSGNRRVLVVNIEGEPRVVKYCDVVGQNNRMFSQMYRSKYARFQAAFELLNS